MPFGAFKEPGPPNGVVRITAVSRWSGEDSSSPLHLLTSVTEVHRELDSSKLSILMVKYRFWGLDLNSIYILVTFRPNN